MVAVDKRIREGFLEEATFEMGPERSKESSPAKIYQRALKRGEAGTEMSQLLRLKQSRGERGP